MAIINERIKERRVSLGLTLLEIAEFLNVKEATMQRYESGSIKNIKHDTVLSLSKVLQCSPSYLMGWSDDIFPPETASKSSHSNNKVESHSERIMEYMCRLNKDGIDEMYKRMDELTKLEMYTKKSEPAICVLKAAHAISGASKEDVKHDEDIMNDDNIWGK